MAGLLIESDDGTGFLSCGNAARTLANPADCGPAECQERKARQRPGGKSPGALDSGRRLVPCASVSESRQCAAPSKLASPSSALRSSSHPAKLAALMTELAHIEPGEEVLEPSAAATGSPPAQVGTSCHVPYALLVQCVSLSLVQIKPGTPDSSVRSCRRVRISALEASLSSSWHFSKVSQHCDIRA